MENRMKFIKLFDENVASALEACGFSYTQERVNGNETVYCFEAGQEVKEALQEMLGATKYAETVIVEDDTLLF